MAVWSNEAVTDFITLYKSHPCLWKIKSPDYKSRTAKYRAYEELVEFCKGIGFKSANSDTVRKKIQSLRGAFRKELRKLIASLETNEEERYKPNLWYFDQLIFTKDQELTDDVETGEEADGAVDNEDGCNSNEQWDMKIATVNLPCTFADSDSTNFAVQKSPYDASTSRNNENEIEQPLPVNWIKSERGKRKLPPDSPAGYVSVCPSGVALSDISETEAIGINVARKLQRMSKMQALHAETVINSILRKGLMNQLTQDTDICDNQCSKNCFG